MRLNRYSFIIGLLIYFSSASAQTINQPVKGWQNLDFQNDGFFGISTEKAYRDLLKNKPCKEVIVAVIDGGVDIRHEDLGAAIWVNPKETPGNKKDDDGNGFVDDIHGWNFYKETIRPDTAEIKDKLKVAKEDKLAFENILKSIGKDQPTIEDFKNYIPKSASELLTLKNIVSGLRVVPGYIAYKRLNLDRAIYLYTMQLEYEEHQDYDPASGGPTAYHGTHIAGIIAADRDNGIGVNGIAKNAKIMVLRAIGGVEPVREGAQPGLKMGLKSDAENEEKQANEAKAKSIRYAVDNGAKVINMSFGQSWGKISPEYDQAIKYALSHDVLIIHASGNESLNLDSLLIYPNRRTDDGKNTSSQWIEVGASGYKKDDKVAASFSNYGAGSVDVYAPGVEITSSVPRSQYMADSGTSMAAPVVAGMAALIRGYYPKLNAKQVKEIIMKSVVKVEALKEKCITAGVINAYEALKLANSY